MSDWQTLLDAYQRARAAELAFDAEHIDPIVGDLPIGAARNAACDSIPPEIWEEGCRLTDLRWVTEDPLMACPSPGPQAFAIKYLIAHGEARDTDCWDGMLEAEAVRFSTGLAAYPEWDAAETSLAQAEADLDALGDSDADDEAAQRLVDEITARQLALVALRPRTSMQALRRYEIATTDGDLRGVDVPAVFADLKRLVEADHA